MYKLRHYIRSTWIIGCDLNFSLKKNAIRRHVTTLNILKLKWHVFIRINWYFWIASHTGKQSRGDKSRSLTSGHWARPSGRRCGSSLRLLQRLYPIDKLFQDDSRQIEGRHFTSLWWMQISVILMDEMLSLSLSKVMMHFNEHNYWVELLIFKHNPEVFFKERKASASSG